jgi:hypothetical protein
MQEIYWYISAGRNGPFSGFRTTFSCKKSTGIFLLVEMGLFRVSILLSRARNLLEEMRLFRVSILLSRARNLLVEMGLFRVSILLSRARNLLV